MNITTIESYPSDIYSVRTSQSYTKTRWQRSKRFLYDPDTKLFCNRTFKSWSVLLGFYLTFTVFCIGIFYLFLYLETYGIQHGYPNTPWFPKKMLMKDSFPGLSFVPNIAITPTPIIWYTSSGADSPYNMHSKSYIDAISKFLGRYERAEQESVAKPNGTYVDCESEHKQPPGKVCVFKKSRLRFCGKPDYGYDSKKPCFYLKLNKLFNWKPVGLDYNKLPKDMPKELQRVVKSVGSRDYIWVSCKGLTPMDTEHLGNILYYPQQGFPSYYFPYNGHKNYLAPLVAVHLEEIELGTVVTVECRIWAKNIEHSETSSNDKVFVKVYIDKK